jgi:hypothetical protein
MGRVGRDKAGENLGRGREQRRGVEERMQGGGERLLKGTVSPV